MKPVTLQIFGLLILAVFISSCIKQTRTEEANPINPITTDNAPLVQQPLKLPTRYQTASYVLDQPEAEETQLTNETPLKVGAKITSTGGPRPLWNIVKRLVSLKGMNVSWASDVDKNVLVDVDINPDDDFYQALDDMLRQVDYFHETRGKTLIIKYRETRQFQISMPFTSYRYRTAVGGNLLGSSGSDGGGARQLDGILDLRTEETTFDLWENLASNLETILDIWKIDKEKTVEQNTTPYQYQTGFAEHHKSSDKVEEQREETENRQKPVSHKKARNFYIIDKPVGTVTVTAPRPVLDRIDNYINTLKKKLYKQVAIEAKIIEVQVDNESNIGIDWNRVFKNFKLFSGTLTFGANGQIYPYIKNNPSRKIQRTYTDREGNILNPEANNQLYFFNAIDPGQFVSRITMGPANFDMFINALKEEGQTKILSNPKISVMNGQPAMITVGQNITYIDKITIERDNETNITTFSPTTSRVLSGVGMALTATILDEDQIIMNLVPITSELVGNEIPYEIIGSEGVRVGVPVINVREMSTTVKIGDGEMLVIGGLISDAESNRENFAPILGDIPGIRYLFGYENKKRKKREMIILLRPRII